MQTEGGYFFLVDCGGGDCFGLRNKKNNMPLSKKDDEIIYIMDNNLSKKVSSKFFLLF